ncbi:MAG: hypothetical protein HYX62_06045 [Gammaproteobacteria bacterium]|nr:hypothetical protein [Gammaproteobacteria bacterium]
MANKFAVSCLPLLIAVSACATDHSEAMKRFKAQRDKNVSEKANINDFIGPNKLSVVRDVREVRPGVLEYSFEPRHYWSEEVKCKYIFVVAKDTGTVIGWRYNGKPENCLQAR